MQPEQGVRAVRFKGFDDTMTKLSGYNGLRMEGDIERGQFRRIEICGRRMDVDD